MKYDNALLDDLMASYELPVVNAETVPMVALESMNETHLEEIELINQLGALVIEGLDGAENSEILEQKLIEWLEHTRAHFGRENQLMSDHGFPAYPVHSAEHERVLGQLEQLYSTWKSDGDLQPVAEYLFVNWPSWFDTHLKTMDMVTARFLQMVR